MEGLGEFEPHEGHEDQDGVVEELEEGEFPATEDGEEGAEGVEETGEVEDVGPKEDAPRWARAEGEAEEPLKWGGFRAAPEPPGVADLGGCGEEDAGEDGGRYQGHGEAVNSGDGSQGDGTATVEEEEVEKEREGDVGGDGGEKEGPGGAPRLGVTPPEADD